MTNDPTTKQQLRESLTAEIIADLEYDIDTALFWAPDSLTDADRKAIRDQVIAEARMVTDALSTAELRNDGARRAYTCKAMETVRHMINLRLAQAKRS